MNDAPKKGLSPLAIAGERFVAAMLDAEHRGEGHREPALGDGASHTQIVRRIGEGDVVRTGLEPFDESERVLAMHANGVTGAEQLDVVLNRAKAGRRDLDQVGGCRAARDRFDAERPGACAEVEHARFGKERPDDAHPRLPHPVGSGPHLAPDRRCNHASPPASGDDAHGSGAEVRELRLQPRDTLILVALQPEGDVEWAVDVDLANAMAERPSERFEGLVIGLQT